MGALEPVPDAVTAALEIVLRNPEYARMMWKATVEDHRPIYDFPNMRGILMRYGYPVPTDAADSYFERVYKALIALRPP